jgi:hypothetical protein
MAFEDSFGYLSDYSDEALISYIKNEWMKSYPEEVILVMYKFESSYWSKILPVLDTSILFNMKNYYTTNQAFPHPSYVDLILESIDSEIKSRGH